MTNPVRRRVRQLTNNPVEDYDERDRWLDDKDGGERWRRYAACRDEDPALFFPLEVETRVVDGVAVKIQTDNEPAYPPPNVKAICDRCAVRGQCLNKFIDEDEGIFGGMTGFQRRLLTKKEKRKRCVGCQSTDVVRNGNEKKELCLACGNSWDVL